MRDQDRTRLSVLCLASAALFAAVAAAQEWRDKPPPLVGPSPTMEPTPAPPLPDMVADDVRKMRNYPEQPPVIPHSISGYQLSLNANRCLECHRREFTEATGAPMISVTHFMDRDYQVLSDVAPRRYFCLQCHVPQADTRPLVENEFIDMITIGRE